MEKISVITVCYNAISTLENTILSVLNQTYPNIEYIIIDGGSTDGSVDIIKKYADRLAYWVSEPDNGIYDAMNKGVDCCSGEWINFMNAGDSFYADNTISLLFNHLGDAAVDIIYGDVNCIFDWGEKIVKPVSLEMIQNRMIFCHQASFVRSVIMKKYKYDTDYKIISDYKFFYERFLEGNKFHYIPLCIANYEAISGISAKSTIEFMKEIARFKGDLHTWHWRLKFCYKYVYFKISNLVQCMLPKKVLYRIKRFKNM